MVTVDHLVRQALTWTGTPYRHGQHSRYGCDCIGLIIGIAKELALIEPHYRPAPYSRQYHLHHSEERLLRGIEDCGGYRLALDQAQPGLIVIDRYGLVGAHCALLLPGKRRLHASLDAATVVIERYRRFPHKRTMALYALPRVSYALPPDDCPPDDARRVSGMDGDPCQHLSLFPVRN